MRESIGAAGAEALYLPPYFPDLNSIEKAWSKLKQLLRSAKARNKEALEQTITEPSPSSLLDQLNETILFAALPRLFRTR